MTLKAVSQSSRRGPPGAAQSTRRFTRVFVSKSENPSWCFVVKANTLMPVSAKRRIQASASKRSGLKRFARSRYSAFRFGSMSRNGQDSPLRCHSEYRPQWMRTPNFRSRKRSRAASEAWR